MYADQADISTEIDDEQSTVASEDNGIRQTQSFAENDKKEISTTDASPLSLETNSHSSTPIASNSPISSPTLQIDKMKNDAKSNEIHELNAVNELPKLRLNITLASDPALQPEAKDIQSIRANTVENFETESNCDDDMRDGSISPTILVQDDDPPPEKIRRRNDSTAFPSNKFVVNASAGTVVNANEMLPRVPAFVCAPCGIKFSSMSTLEAHQTFYCTHR